MKMMDHPSFQGYEFEREEEKQDSSVLVFRNETGVGEMLCFEVFPGVTFSYNSLKMATCYQQTAPMHGYISLNYCRKGCFEVNVDGSGICYMSEGDLVISDPARCIITDTRVPQGFYEGVSIMIERIPAGEWIRENAPWIGELIFISDEFDKRTLPISVLANKPELWHLTEGLYTSLARSSSAYRTIKMLELLNLLSTTMQDETPASYFSPAVTEATQAAYRYLSRNLTEKITADALCAKFGVSKTNFTKCFKAIYGQTPAKYLRNERMKYASVLLKESGKSVGEIASMLGYDNASKFSAAFRSVMNECPLEYRRNVCCADAEKCQEFKTE